jgi:hypothetical protein
MTGQDPDSDADATSDVAQDGEVDYNNSSTVSEAMMEALSRRSFVLLTPLSPAMLSGANPVVKPVASFVANCNVEGTYPCYYCEDVVLQTKSSLTSHYTFCHFRHSFKRRYGIKGGNIEAGLHLTCQLCEEVFHSLKNFLYHVGVMHMKLQEVLPPAAWSALGRL